MERLTFYNNFCEACYRTKQYSSIHMRDVNAVISNDAVTKLAAYEDTGLSPEQISEAQKAMNATLGLACEAQAARNEISRLRRELDAAVVAVVEMCHAGHLCRHCGADCADAGKSWRECSDSDKTFQCGAFKWRGVPSAESEAAT